VINAMMIGYAPAAMAWSHQQARGELARLAPLLQEQGEVSRPAPASVMPW
jgi:hypothetical protein